jgi:hypothetical protein
MKKVIKVQTESEILSEVLCNQCGGSCHVEEAGRNKHGQHYFFGLINAKVVGGYHSPVLGDLDQYEFSLCEACLKKMFAGFKLPVDVIELNFG